LKILDVGCGGGILCEPLARLGATVTGIDASLQAIQVAQQHAQQMGLDISYHHATVESMPGENFDVICALEIIEHVDQPQEFIKACSRLLSPHGLFFISTLNKTIKSYLQGIIAAEYILRWVPKGTHDWQKFVPPSQLADWLREMGLSFMDLKGFHYNPLHFLSTHQPLWSLSQSLGVNYIGCAKF
jgi:2-polyprenyl-6-hydroxyphenyl methylase/3-demethylubiquinone-9 3-methyltransferase